MIHIWRPWKLLIFQDPPPPLSIYVENSSTPSTLDVQLETNPHPLYPPPPSPNDNQSIKIKHNPRMTIQVVRSFLQVGFRFQHQLVNLGGHSKSTFARNFQFLTPSPSLVKKKKFLFVLHVIPPFPQRTFALVSYPLPLSKKVSRRFWRLFRIKNRGVKRQKRIIFFANST